MSTIIIGDTETESIDKLFLELSQFTRAKTKKEIDMGNAIAKAYKHLYAKSTGQEKQEDIHQACVTLRDAMTYLVNK